MKQLVFTFLLITLFSCNSKENYEGKWTNSDLKFSYEYNETNNVIIEKDSIKFQYPYFEFWNKYPLSIENKNFHFNDITLKAITEKDTLTLNDSIHFVRDEEGKYRSKFLLKINLPQLSNINKIEKEDYVINRFIYIGKRIDNNEFSLQVNDKYADAFDLRSFLINQSQNKRYEVLPFYSNLLFIDCESKMAEIEKVLLVFFANDEYGEICFVSNIDLNYNKQEGLYYEYQTLNLKIPSFQTNEEYFEKVFNSKIPPLPHYNISEDDSTKINFFYLIQNRIYFNDDIIDELQLPALVNECIKKNEIVMSLYDLESDYYNFIKLNSIIDNEYNKSRNELSNLKFKREFNDLNNEEKELIKLQLKKKYIWGHSIPHYNSIVKKDSSFFGLKVHPIDLFNLKLKLLL